MAKIQISLPCLLMLAAFAVEAGGETDVRTYPLPGHGRIKMNVPATWKNEIRQSPNGSASTITFRQVAGDPWEVLVTLIRPANKDLPLIEEEGIRQLVLQGADLVQPHSVEREIALRKLHGASGPGFYFSVTDRSPAPGDYKYLTQGMVRVSNLLISFTIFTNDGQANIVTDALEMLKSAVQVDE